MGNGMRSKARPVCNVVSAKFVKEYPRVRANQSKDYIAAVCC